MEANNEILIIGRPGAGKSGFLGQLYGRLMDRSGKLRLKETPSEIQGIKTVFDRYGLGLEPETTPANENLEISIPVLRGEEEILLRCKDYGGEQVRDLTKLLEYDKTWIDRAKQNDRWVLFIRPSTIGKRFDLSMKGHAEVDDDDTENHQLGEVTSDQSHFIELLQVLLHARGIGIKEQVRTPRLMIVLTCWDELESPASPVDELKSKTPLFYHFLKSNWSADHLKVMGLSAQGLSLKPKENQEKYLDELPENFGYLVLEENPKEQEPDLTLLIEEVLCL